MFCSDARTNRSISSVARTNQWNPIAVAPIKTYSNPSDSNALKARNISSRSTPLFYRLSGLRCISKSLGSLGDEASQKAVEAQTACAIKSGSQVFRRHREVILFVKFVEFVGVFTDYWPRIPRISTN